MNLCSMLPGKPASLCSCEGSLLSLCHFFCLDRWLWIKTSFSCWYIFLFVKSILMPVEFLCQERVNQEFAVVARGGFLTLRCWELCWKTQFEASWARFWPLFGYKDHKAVYRSYTSRPSDLDAKYQRPRFALWLFVPQWGELVELGLRNLSVRFSNISGYNTAYYASFHSGVYWRNFGWIWGGGRLLAIFF